MARSRRRRDEGPLPPPLPPETRTVGQLVAEAMRLYGGRFWRFLPLGLVLALIDQVSFGLTTFEQAVVLWLGAPLMTAAYVTASALVVEARATATAFVVGLLVFLPVPALQLVYALPAVAWLAFLGLSVPAAMRERLGFRAALERGRRLAQADYVHALGSLATLTVVFALSKLMLYLLLRSQGDNGARAATFLADLVLSPLLYVGGALLYFDQVARLESGGRATRRNDADVRVAEHADPAGRADVEVEP
jgi:hypothetical protein